MTDYPKHSINIALAQIDIQLGDVRTNCNKATEFISRAAGLGADLVLLPELWSTGYDLEQSRIHAETTRLEILPYLEQVAREYQVYVAGSVLLGDEQGQVFNSAMLVDSGGTLIGIYRKVHLFGLMEEDRYLSAGADLPTMPLPWCEVGFGICYDLRFPELFRKYALDGVSLVLMPAEWPTSRLDHWQTLIRARALENQYFVAACNRVGSSKSTEFCGHSMVVDPWGTVLVEGNGNEELLLAVIDLERIQESRKRISALRDRRPAAYISEVPVNSVEY